MPNIPGLNTAGFSNTAALQQSGRNATNDRVQASLQQLQQLIAQQQSASLDRERLNLDRISDRSNAELEALSRVLLGRSIEETGRANRAGESNQLAQLAELIRSNQASEGLGQDRLRLSARGQDITEEDLAGRRDLAAQGLGLTSDRLALDREVAEGQLSQGDRKLDQSARALNIDEFRAVVAGRLGIRDLDQKEARLLHDVSGGDADRAIRIAQLIEDREEAERNRNFQSQERKLDRASQEKQTTERVEGSLQETKLRQGIDPVGQASYSAQQLINGEIKPKEFITFAAETNDPTALELLGRGAEIYVLNKLRDEVEGKGAFNLAGVNEGELNNLINTKISPLYPLLSQEFKNQIQPLFRPESRIQGLDLLGQPSNTHQRLDPNVAAAILNQKGKVPELEKSDREKEYDKRQAAKKSKTKKSETRPKKLDANNDGRITNEEAKAYFSGLVK